MWRFVEKIPYLTKRIANKRNKGQALVEFAMISLLLFMLIIGIMEMGRFMFIWTQLASAAQEGARYGASHPLEVISLADDGLNVYPCTSHNDQPCNIVSQARARVVLLEHNDVTVTVSFDNGADPTQGGATVYPWGFPVPVCPSSVKPTWNVGRDRVVVQASYQFHFLIGIFDNFAPQGLPMRMVSARTVMANETEPYQTGCTYDPNATPTSGPQP